MVDSQTVGGYDYVLVSHRVAGERFTKGSLKIRMRSRSVKASSLLTESYKRLLLEGDLQWDADRDETKQIVVRASTIQYGYSYKVNTSVSFPGIGKVMLL